MKMKETSITKNKTMLKRPQVKHCDTIFYHGIIQGFGILKPNTQPCHGSPPWQGSPPPWGSNLFLDKKVANPERSESMNTFKNNNY